MDKELIGNINEKEYGEILQQAILEIRATRTTLARQVNSTVNSAYWNIGKLLVEKLLNGIYGSGVVKRLSTDLKSQFRDMGLSPRNLWYMKRYYELYYKVDTKVQRSVALLPWGHNVVLMHKELTIEQVFFYSQETVQKGWNKDMLLNALKLNSYEISQDQNRNSNFDVSLPHAQANYANEVFKSSYNLGFIEITEPLKELEFEKRLVAKIKSFILELGKGFSFIGN